MLLVDAVLTGANGLAYLVLAGWLDELLGVSRGLLVGLGVFLLVVAAAVGWLATRVPIPRAGLLVLGSLNLGWVLASAIYAFAGDLTTTGTVWVLLQAAIVLAFAVRQLQLARR